MNLNGPIARKCGRILCRSSEVLVHLYLFLLLMDVLTEDMRKDVPGSMMFADDIVLCGDDETDMTEYCTWRPGGER